MRVTEILRGLLDLIDQIEDEQTSKETPYYDDEARRMDQIDDLQGCNPDTEYANEPDPRYSDIAAVTVDAGGGWQEPKHPDDIRGDSIRIHGGN